MGPDEAAGHGAPGAGAPGGKRPTGAEHPPVIEAAQLFGTAREVLIAHRGERYRLRITQSGKLILTK